MHIIYSMAANPSSLVMKPSNKLVASGSKWNSSKLSKKNSQKLRKEFIIRSLGKIIVHGRMMTEFD